jgi:hypothetical protein
MKAALSLAGRLAALTLIHFICFAVISAAVLPPASQQVDPSQAGAAAGAGVAAGALLVVSLLNTVTLGYLILRSRWAGWKLIIAIFLVFYGVMTVLPQIETAFFVTRLPPGMLPRLFLAGALTAAIFSPLAILILGKRKSDRTGVESAPWRMPVGEWLARLSGVVAAYIVIYFTFGYFIAWKNPAVRAYYGGTDPGSFFAQMRGVLRETPWLLPLQAVRALLWTAIAVLVARMMKGPWWEAALAVAVLFAVMSSQLLLPNPYMPQEVRMVHLLETATSNFLFGWLIVVVLRGVR